MSRSVNRVFLAGHLGHAPEMRETKDGRPYARLRVATARYRGPDLEEATDWHSVFVYGDTGAMCGKMLRKGAMVFVEGQLRYWESGDEQNKYRQAVTADRVDFITYGGRGDREEVDNSSAPRNHNAVAHL